MSDEHQKPSSTIAPAGSIERKLDDALNACVPDFNVRVNEVSESLWMYTDENRQLLAEDKLRHSKSSIEGENVAHAVGDMVSEFHAILSLSKRVPPDTKEHYIAEKGAAFLERHIPQLRGYFEDEKYEAIHDEGMAFIGQLEEIQSMLKGAQSTDKSKGSSKQR